MTFLELQNATMNDRFTETQRAEIKDWINSRYGRVWAQDSWSFKITSTLTSIAASATTISLASLNLQRVESVWDSTYGAYNVEIDPLRPEKFYQYTATYSGYPMNYTVINGNIVFDRPASQTRSIIIVGEQRWTRMTADGDIPALPDEFHFMLVHGASSEGLRLQNDPTWKDFEDDFQRYLVDMRASYLAPVRTFGDAMPSWPNWY